MIKILICPQLFFNLRLRLPITLRSSPQHGQGIFSSHLTEKTGQRVFNQIIFCYNNHDLWGIPLVNLLVQIYAENGGIFSFSLDMVIISSLSWTGNPVSNRTFLYPLSFHHSLKHIPNLIVCAVRNMAFSKLYRRYQLFTC